MAKIIINDTVRVNGKITFKREANEDNTGFVIRGMFATHLYFDEIISLDTPRFKLTGVEVYEEDFGSDDYNILYSFKADNLEIFGAESNGAYYILYGEEMKMIEEEMYKNDHPTLGDIGEEYKYMFVEENDDESKEEEKEE